LKELLKSQNTVLQMDNYRFRSAIWN